MFLGVGGGAVSRAHDLTAEARAGYDGNANPHLWSSPSWYAHALGKMLHDTGRTPPRGVRMGRGSKMHANDMLFEYQHGAGREYWERVK